LLQAVDEALTSLQEREKEVKRLKIEKRICQGIIVFLAGWVVYERVN
jgi:hypothetical protein